MTTADTPAVWYLIVPTGVEGNDAQRAELGAVIVHAIQGIAGYWVDADVLRAAVDLLIPLSSEPAEGGEPA